MKLTDYDSIVLTYERMGTKGGMVKSKDVFYDLLMGPTQSWYPEEIPMPSYIFKDDKGKTHEFKREQVPNVELKVGDKFSARRHYVNLFGKGKIVLSESVCEKIVENS